MDNDGRGRGSGISEMQTSYTCNFCFWKTEIKYANTMAETSLWIYLYQSLILPEEQPVVSKS